ncbi:hypothetical protein ACI65C_013504 [Semiaphis heraclei]
MEAKPEWIKYGATILGTYDDFDKGMKKLKKAEDRDVPLTTDAEKDKVNRKLRHKRAYTSSDDSTEEKFTSITRVPKSTDSSVDSNNSNNTSEKKKIKVKSKLFTDESVDKIVKPRMIYDVDSSDEEDVSTLYHNKATTSEIQKPKEKTLFNASQHINKHLVNSYHQPESKGFRGSPVNHSKYQYINDQNNYNSEIISNRGGIKTDDITKLILRKLFTDKFAASYNWTGAKGKKPLSSLLLSKIIIDAVFKNANNSKKLLKQKDDVANDLVM